MADTPLDRVLDKTRYGEEERQLITSLIEIAEDSDGIPEPILLPRVEEARAKRVPAEVLLDALVQEIERLSHAREILLESTDGYPVLESEAGWIRTATLILWGAPDSEIRLLVGAAAGDVEIYLEASNLLTALDQWGLDRQPAMILVQAVAGSSLKPADYRGILDLLIQGRKNRQPVGIFVQAILRELPEIESFRQLRRKVLR